MQRCCTTEIGSRLKALGSRPELYKYSLQTADGRRTDGGQTADGQWTDGGFLAHSSSNAAFYRLEFVKDPHRKVDKELCELCEL